MNNPEMILSHNGEYIGLGRAELLKHSLRQVPSVDKDSLIVELCAGKSVLDLWFIGHSLKRVEKLGEDWLHKRIKDKASSVLGVDILEHECNVLRRQGYDNVCQDVLSLNLNKKFEIIVCADIIEHVSNVGIFLERMKEHLSPEGRIIISTPNPFNIEQFVRILKSGSVGVNSQHTAWIDLNTMYELCSRAGICIVDQYWIATQFSCVPHMRPYRLIARVVRFLQDRRPYLRTDFLVVCMHDKRSK